MRMLIYMVQHFGYLHYFSSTAIITASAISSSLSKKSLPHNQKCESKPIVTDVLPKPSSSLGWESHPHWLLKKVYSRLLKKINK